MPWRRCIPRRCYWIRLCVDSEGSSQYATINLYTTQSYVIRLIMSPSASSLHNQSSPSTQILDRFSPHVYNLLQLCFTRITPWSSDPTVSPACSRVSSKMQPLAVDLAKPLSFSSLSCRAARSRTNICRKVPRKNHRAGIVSLIRTDPPPTAPARSRCQRCVRVLTQYIVQRGLSSLLSLAR